MQSQLRYALLLVHIEITSAYSTANGSARPQSKRQTKQSNQNFVVVSWESSVWLMMYMYFFLILYYLIKTNCLSLRFKMPLFIYFPLYCTCSKNVRESPVCHLEALDQVDLLALNTYFHLLAVQPVKPVVDSLLSPSPGFLPIKWQWTSASVIQHYCHGITISIHPKLI